MLTHTPYGKRLAINLLAITTLFTCSFSLASAKQNVKDRVDIRSQLISAETPRIMAKVKKYLPLKPQTVVDFIAKRSTGGPHDFYSEGDYWWPNPQDPNGPYIRKDGLSNPDNFIKHRLLLIKLSDIVATLTSAYILDPQPKYFRALNAQLDAWFVNSQTRMTPNLLHSQAIKGRNSGRSIGVIDTIHLTEVARSIYVLEKLNPKALNNIGAIKNWFSEYLHWLVYSPFGKKERVHPNNHGVCWAMQAAAFAQLVGDKKLLADIRHDFKSNFVGKMMAHNGSFPAELARTKPYGYSLFVLDAMATTAQLASIPNDNLWQYSAKDGRGMRKAMQYMVPYIVNKKSWPLKPDVLYWNKWPVKQPALIFAALQYHNQHYFNVWAPLKADPTEYEVLRNLPVRHPLIWLHYQ